MRLWLQPLLLLALTSACGDDGATAPDVDLEPRGTLGPALLEVVDSTGVPALAAYAFRSDGSDGVGAAGLRRSDRATQVELDDRWHIGSNAKAMTVVLVARLDELGALSIDATVGDFFSDLAIDPGFDDTTLADLLAHRGGAPESGSALFESVLSAGTTTEQRAALAQKVLEAPPSLPRGTFGYSNAGYVLVGAAVEEATAQSWESLMSEHVFAPLQMTSCGFGGPDVNGDVSDPWGHVGNAPVAPGPGGDNPPLVGPAGTVHCSLEDWAKFARDQLRGARGEPALLPADAYTRMQTPPDDGSYAMGWGVEPIDGGVLLLHDGSNDTFSSAIFMVPHTDRGLLLAVNRGGDEATVAALETAATVVGNALATSALR